MANLSTLLIKKSIEDLMESIENDENEEITSLGDFSQTHANLIREHKEFMQNLNFVSNNFDEHWALMQNMPFMTEFDIMRAILTNERLENTPELMELIKLKRMTSTPEQFPITSSTVPAVQAVQAVSQTSFPDSGIDQATSTDNEDFCMLGAEDLVSCKQIIRDVMPVIVRDRNCTWKVNFSSFKGKIFLNWSICEALVNVGINNIDAFKVKTLIGTHKKSMSERNGFKYSAAIEKWSIITDEQTGNQSCMFELMPVMIGGIMTTYEIIVHVENCDIANRFALEKQLTDYTNYMWNSRDLTKAAEHYRANVIFTRKLFNCK